MGFEPGLRDLLPRIIKRQVFERGIAFLHQFQDALPALLHQLPQNIQRVVRLGVFFDRMELVAAVMHLDAQHALVQSLVIHYKVVFLHLIGLVVDHQLLRAAGDPDIVLVVLVCLLFVLVLIELALVLFRCGGFPQ